MLLLSSAVSVCSSKVATRGSSTDVSKLKATVSELLQNSLDRGILILSLGEALDALSCCSQHPM